MLQTFKPLGQEYDKFSTEVFLVTLMAELSCFLLQLIYCAGFGKSRGKWNQLSFGLRSDICVLSLPLSLCYVDYLFRAQWAARPSPIFMDGQTTKSGTCVASEFARFLIEHCHCVPLL